MVRIVLPIIALVAGSAGCSQILGLEPATERASDAGAPPGDAAIATPPNDCTTYCTSITANCSGVNAQFGGSSAAEALLTCMLACATFDPGVAMTMTGATLGCRIYYATNATVTTLPDVLCPYAGPAGDQVSGTGRCGDPCTNFCSLEIAACGIKGVDPNGQYASMSECMTGCANFDKIHRYAIDARTFPSANPSGDSLACRLYQTTRALLSGGGAAHCPFTKAVSTSGPCIGPPVP